MNHLKSVLSEVAKDWRQACLEALDVGKLQLFPFLLTLALVGVIFLLSATIEPGWTTYILCLPPAVVIGLTTLARANDIGPENMEGRWHARRIGLVLAGVGAGMVLAAPFTKGVFPQWRLVVVFWGVAITWITTPGMVPWDVYVTGKYKDPRMNELARWAAYLFLRRGGGLQSTEVDAMHSRRRND